MITSN